MSIKRHYNDAEVLAAADILVAGYRNGMPLTATAHPYSVLSDFRTAHSAPAGILRLRLNPLVEVIDPHGFVSMRIKRLPTILDKLAHRVSRITILQMQDIGGCRVVVDSVEAVEGVAESFPASRQGLHEFVPIPSLTRNYISKPPPSGYRGLHLIHEYSTDISPGLNGLRVETQVRTRRQHAWATAEETVEEFTGQRLKSGKASEDWTRFFALASAAIARIEGTARVPNVPKDQSRLLFELKTLRQTLEVDALLLKHQNKMTVDFVEDSGPTKINVGYIFTLNASEHRLSVSSVAETNSVSQAYEASEQQAMVANVTNTVFVSVERSQLPTAYPNYYADTREFLRILDEVLA
jgi:ppGpp synthetase/RelA/SpoT-type nucleotidyltranferase